MPTAPSIPYHVPVLAESVRAWAAGSRRAVDATLGGGGHAAIFRELGATVLGIDRDPEAIAAVRRRLGTTGLQYLEASFAAPAAIAAIREFHPDHILLDLGVSSHQIDSTERGFTFRPGAPLDMRMEGRGKGEEGRGITAADVLNSWPVERLSTVFSDYADERRARALAKEVVRRRLSAPFGISDDFVNAIRAVLGPRSGPPDFARLFQALRIAVNEELDSLETALPELRDALVPRGSLGVITYHSGEDRIVKHAFREWSRECVCPPRQPVCTCRGRALGRVVTKKSIVPDASEIAANPRARSARFRAFEVADGV
ncbi:MAG: 16S rRNA (cytosine(1402)-N(4))-methyltransferase [Gemmatimonadetes bacterium 13_2_20CM_2_65_7]|nr:MAG: 16S rRNA (cytosine(1402)-N(4))-methyltransferase [Gemmatimonadetes bacterium 13_2_20CM_2_65_7]OLC40710.1 MAG: 16S rRNA (cytosine(1402)-N(4))-methyltransferase [Gemmatimonadetes bacterium 13_1_40CM_4_65_7]